MVRTVQRSHKLKGQSAIEYLMTYGWMLLVVAIASGVVFAQVGNTCSDSANGFTAASVSVENFAVDPDTKSLGLVLRNNVGNNVEISEITLDDGDNNISTSSFDKDSEIAPAESKSLSVTGAEESSACNEVEVEIIYSIDSGNSQLSGQKVSGTLNGGLSIEQIDPPAPVQNVEATY